MQTSTIKKHILHLPNWYPHPADPQNGVFIRKQIESLDPVFHNSVLFVKSARQEAVYQIETKQENQIDTCIVYFREFNGLRIFKSWVHIWRYLSGFKKGLYQLMKSNGQPDLMHAHVLLRTALLAWYYARKFKISYIISEHWSGFITGAFNKKNFVYRYLSKAVLKKAAGILVVSETLGSAIVKLGMPEQKMKIIPNVVEVGEFVDKTKVTNVKDSVILLSVADLVDDIKKISEVIEAVADLSIDCDLEYWIIGDGQDRQKLEAMARSKGLLGETVKFFGRKTNEEVLKIISQCDFLVMNSVIETFSVVTAEALLAGKPVVATRCGGPEIFVNDSNGTLIEVGNRKELKDAIGTMIKTYQDFDQEALRAGVEDRFSSKAIGLKLKAIYDDILSK